MLRLSVITTHCTLKVAGGKWLARIRVGFCGLQDWNKKFLSQAAWGIRIERLSKNGVKTLRRLKNIKDVPGFVLCNIMEMLIKSAKENGG